MEAQPQRRGAIFLALVGWLPAVVVGHGMLTYPPTRFPNAGPGFTGMFPFGSSFCASRPRLSSRGWVRASRLIPRVRLAGFNQGCSIGCEKCSGTSCDEFNGDGSTLGKPQKCCEHPMEPTLFARGPGGPDADSLSPRTYNEHQTPGAGAYDRFHYTVKSSAAGVLLPRSHGC